MNKVKPLWVYVYWSESSEFKDKELLPFAEFERIAKRAAMAVGEGNGYDKTKIRVLFSDGEYYDTRLDLCPGEDHGFRSYCNSMIEWIGSERYLNTYEHDKQTKGMYIKLKDYIESIEWGE